MQEKESRNQGVFKDLPQKSIWNYPYFREYLLALGRDSLFVESIRNFPIQIELSRQWHGALNQLRAETAKDGNERHIFIATDQSTQSILLPKKTAVGNNHSVPFKEIRKHRQWGESKNVGKIIGSIHSHPNGNPNLIERLLTLSFYFGHFSVGDLYCLLSRKPEYVKGLSDSSENILAFRTRETGETNLNYLLVDKSQKDFKNYWYTKHGIRINLKDNSIQRIDGDNIGDKDLINISLTIAKMHNLVIYRGRPDHAIRRIFPPVN